MELPNIKTKYTQWKPVFQDGVKTKFIVSSNGQVKDTDTNKYLNQHYTGGRKGHRYLRVSLITSPGTKNYVYVHRLVAEAFVHCPLSGLEVNHIDRNTSNNNMNNLEWITHSENLSKRMSDKFADMPTEEVVKMRILYKHGISIAEIARTFSISPYFTKRVVRYEVFDTEMYKEAEDNFSYEEPRLF